MLVSCKQLAASVLFIQIILFAVSSVNMNGDINFEISCHSLLILDKKITFFICTGLDNVRLN